MEYSVARALGLDRRLPVRFEGPQLGGARERVIVPCAAAMLAGVVVVVALDGQRDRTFFFLR